MNNKEKIIEIINLYLTSDAISDYAIEQELTNLVSEIAPIPATVSFDSVIYKTKNVRNTFGITSIPMKSKDRYEIKYIIDSKLLYLLNPSDFIDALLLEVNKSTMKIIDTYDKFLNENPDYIEVEDSMLLFLKIYNISLTNMRSSLIYSKIINKLTDPNEIESYVLATESGERISVMIEELAIKDIIPKIFLNKIKLIAGHYSNVIHNKDLEVNKFYNKIKEITNTENEKEHKELPYDYKSKWSQ